MNNDFPLVSIIITTKNEEANIHPVKCEAIFAKQKLFNRVKIASSQFSRLQRYSNCEQGGNPIFVIE